MPRPRAQCGFTVNTSRSSDRNAPPLPLGVGQKLVCPSCGHEWETPYVNPWTRIGAWLGVPAKAATPLCLFEATAMAGHCFCENSFHAS